MPPPASYFCPVHTVTFPIPLPVQLWLTSRCYCIKFYNNNKEKIIHRVKLQKINKKLTLYDPSYVEQLKQNEDLLNALKETNKTLYRLIYRFNILQIEGQQFL